VRLLTEGETARLRSGAIHLQRMAWSYAARIRIARVRGNVEDAFITGGGILIRMAGRSYLATAWHAFNEWRTKVAQDPTATFLLDDTPLQPPHRVFRDEPNDLAFMTVADQLISREKWPLYELDGRHGNCKPTIWSSSADSRAHCASASARRSCCSRTTPCFNP